MRDEAEDFSVYLKRMLCICNIRKELKTALLPGVSITFSV